MLLELIAEELGPVAAQRVESRALRDMAGVRLTISLRSPLDAREIETVAPGRPREAAKLLGVHPSTVYRALRRPLVR